jgi:hypothetical protein
LPAVVYLAAHLASGAFALFLMRVERSVEYRPISAGGGDGVFTVEEVSDGETEDGIEADNVEDVYYIK